MGGPKTVTTNSTSTPSPSEEALNNQNLQMLKWQEPYQKDMYANLSSNINSILTGQHPMAKVVGGIDQQQNQSMVNDSLRSIMPQFQQNGLMDSGSAIQASARAVQDTSNSNAQFNVSAAQNLFNIAVGGQSNLQGQSNTLNQSLSSQLAGLRQTTGTIRNPSNGLNLGILGSWGGSNYGCWVAAEIFGGWHEYKTEMARFYINVIAPKWFKRFYLKYGEQIAKFISNKPILKIMLRPLFEIFVLRAEWKLQTTFA